MPTPRKHADHAERQRAYVQRQRDARLALLAAKNMPPSSPIPSIPSQARWKALRAQAQEILLAMQAEMRGYRDDRSETWQDSLRAEALEEIIDSVGNALEAVDGIAFS